MGSFESFRKAYGALKDSTTVGLAKVNSSDFKDLDIAVVKATNHVEAPPKERHIKKICGATSVVRSRADVAYCIHALARRLSKTRNWIVAIKVLTVIHRTLREGDPTFREELLHYSQGGHIFQISNFKDDSSPLAWDCSAWIRTYALFLEERLECFRVLKYDIEAESLIRTSPGATKVHSKTRVLTCEELLQQLPALQQLLYRLIGCQPEGLACTNYLVQYALAMILKESFKIYCAINDGIINLVDMYFNMPKHVAVEALTIYKRAGQQAEYISDFYEFSKTLDLARNFQFPTLRQPPTSFLFTMEEYVKAAFPNGTPEKQESEENDDWCEKPEESEENWEEENEPKEEPEEEHHPEPKPRPESPPLISTEDDDLLGLREIDPRVAELEERNALALAIIPPGGENQSSSNRALMEPGTTGWELALVTTTPSNTNTAPQSQTKLGGGFDNLLLDSLYEDENARRQLHMRHVGYNPHDMGFGFMQTHNPFEQQPPNPFYNNMMQPNNMQLTMYGQQLQQQQYYHQTTTMPQQSQMMMMPYQSQSPNQYHLNGYQQPMGTGMDSSNPFGNPFSGYPQNPTPQNHALL